MKILVTDAHEPAALGAIRSLGRAGHQVVATGPRRYGRPAAAWSRHCIEFCHAPDPWRSHPDFRAWLIPILDSREFGAILPIGEGAIAALAALRAQAPPETLLLIPGGASLQYTLSHINATRAAMGAGIPCPPTVFIAAGEDPAAYEGALDALRFPAVVRFDNALTPHGAYRKGAGFTVPSKAAAMRLLEDQASHPGPRMVQERIQSPGLDAFFLRWQGRIVLEFAQHALHEVPHTGGMPSLCESTHDEALLAAGRQVIEALDVEGPATAEFRRDARDGQLYWISLNGRLWNSLALALHCGVDFPRVLLECHQGAPPSAGPPPYPGGIRCRNLYPGEAAYLASILNAVPQRGIPPPPAKIKAVAEFLATALNPAIRGETFQVGDPAPAAALALDLAKRLARKAKDVLLIPWRWKRITIDAYPRLERDRRRAERDFEHLPRRILFVCLGNICRSPFAEAYWNVLRARPGGEDLPEAASAGYYPEAGRRSPAWIQDLAAEFGVELAHHRSRLVTARSVDEADLIFIMDRDNERALRAVFPRIGNKIYYLGAFAAGGPLLLDDPFMATEEEARACYRRLAAALDGLAARMREH